MRLSRGASVAELERVYRADFLRFVRVATAVTGDKEAGADAVHDAFGSGYLVHDGLYVTISSENEKTILDAAHALRPMP